MPPTVIDLKVYVPAENFEESQQFYRDLGFELTEAWGGNFDCRLGNAQFRLQNYYVKDWAENFMLQFGVEDAQAWYEHARSVIDTGRYRHARVGPPEVYGDTTIVHVHDPCGVLLIFIQ
jgi:catechol 2,3-dioxygenase-like lactoylglutathione lyase family enzyme